MSLKTAKNISHLKTSRKVDNPLFQGMPKKNVAHQPVVQKPVPQNYCRDGYLIWGRHALFAALANNNRRIAQIYAASDDKKAELQSQLVKLPLERQNSLPSIQCIDRQRLDVLAGPNDKAVHQGFVAAAV